MANSWLELGGGGPSSDLTPLSAGLPHPHLTQPFLIRPAQEVFHHILCTRVSQPAGLTLGPGKSVMVPCAVPWRMFSPDPGLCPKRPHKYFLTTKNESRPCQKSPWKQNFPREKASRQGRNLTTLPTPRSPASKSLHYKFLEVGTGWLPWAWSLLLWPGGLWALTIMNGCCLLQEGRWGKNLSQSIPTTWKGMWLMAQACNLSYPGG